MILPDFIIAGAPKSGTTALWSFLNQLPQVCMASQKEPVFFSSVKGSMENKIEGDGPRASGNFYKGFEWYASLFKNQKPGQLKGEASTDYFVCEDAAEKIFTYIPHVKLIFMLREPAARTYSHFWQEYKLGFEFPDFETMMKTNHPRFRFFIKTSMYKENLQRFEKYFPENQILILLLEDFEKSPEKEFEKVLSFLGLPKSDASQIDFSRRFNEQVVPKNRTIAKTITQLQFSPIRKILPDSVLKNLNAIKRKFVKANSQKINYEILDPQLKKEIQKILSEDILYIQKKLNRNKEFWLS